MSPSTSTPQDAMRPLRSVKAPKAKKYASKIPYDAELVVCLDGPKAGAWFYLADWKQLRRASLHCGGTPATSEALAYTPTSQRIQHPHEAVKGAGLTYRPAG